MGKGPFPKGRVLCVSITITFLNCENSGEGHCLGKSGNGGLGGGACGYKRSSREPRAMEISVVMTTVYKGDYEAKITEERKM